MMPTMWSHNMFFQVWTAVAVGRVVVARFRDEPVKGLHCGRRGPAHAFKLNASSASSCRMWCSDGTQRAEVMTSRTCGRSHPSARIRGSPAGALIDAEPHRPNRQVGMRSRFASATRSPALHTSGRTAAATESRWSKVTHVDACVPSHRRHGPVA